MPSLSHAVWSTTSPDKSRAASAFQARRRSSVCFQAARPSSRARSRATSRYGEAGASGAARPNRALQTDAIQLAVLASVRHRDIRHNELLMSGVDRATARARQRRRCKHASRMAHRPALRPRSQTEPHTELELEAQRFLWANSNNG